MKSYRKLSPFICLNLKLFNCKFCAISISLWVTCDLKIVWQKLLVRSTTCVYNFTVSVVSQVVTWADKIDSQIVGLLELMMTIQLVSEISTNSFVAHSLIHRKLIQQKQVQNSHKYHLKREIFGLWKRRSNCSVGVTAHSKTSILNISFKTEPTRRHLRICF